MPELEGRITGDPSGFIKASRTAQTSLARLTKKGSKAGKSLAQSFKDIPGGLNAIAKSAAIAGAALVGVGAKAINLAREQIMAGRQLNAVLKSTGGIAGVTAKELKAHAAALQEVTNFGDEVTLGAQAMLLTFTQIGKEVFPETTEAVLNIATAMKTGLKESATLVGKALNDPIKGLTALTRVGITFTKSQREQIKVLVEAGRTLQAQKIILKELEVQFGGSARAVADKLTQLKNTLGDLGEEIGKSLLPVVERGLIPLTLGLAGVAKELPLVTGGVLALTVALVALNVTGLLPTAKGLASLGLRAAAAGFSALAGKVGLTALGLAGRAGLVGLVGSASFALGSLFAKTSVGIVVVDKLSDGLLGLAKAFGIVKEAEEESLKEFQKRIGKGRFGGGVREPLPTRAAPNRPASGDAMGEAFSRAGASFTESGNAAVKASLEFDRAAKAAADIAKRTAEATEALAKTKRILDEFSGIASARGAAQIQKDLEDTVARAATARDAAIQAAKAAGVGELKAARAAFVGLAKGLSEALDSGELSIDAWRTKLTEAKGQLFGVTREIGQRFKENRDAIVGAFNDTSNAILGLVVPVSEFATEFGVSAGLLLESTQEISDAFTRFSQEGGKDFNVQLAQLAELVDDSPEGMRELAEAVGELLAKEQEAADAALKLTEAQDALLKKQEALVVESLKLSSAFPEQTSAVQVLIKHYRAGELSADKFKDAMLALERQVLSTAAATNRAALVGQLQSQFGLGPKAAAAAARGGRASRGVREAVAAANIQSRQVGGFLSRTGPFKGHGGEFVIQRRAAQVIGPAGLRALNKMRRGDINVTNNINASDRSSIGTRAQIREMLPELRRQTKLGILQGGPF